MAKKRWQRRDGKGEMEKERWIRDFPTFYIRVQGPLDLGKTAR